MEPELVQGCTGTISPLTSTKDAMDGPKYQLLCDFGPSRCLAHVRRDELFSTEKVPLSA